MQLLDTSGNIHCALFIGKFCVAPSTYSTKYVPIPRLEQTAATLPVKISKLLQKKLDSELTCNMTEYYWADSTLLLGYINNNVKRFKLFVVNHVQLVQATHMLIKGIMSTQLTMQQIMHQEA